MPLEKHLLIPFDDGPACRHALNYCCLLFGNDPQVCFELLYCRNQPNTRVVPEPIDPESSLLPDFSADTRQEAVANKILKRGFNILQQKGISADRIRLSPATTGNQVAHTIMAKAQQLLVDTIVIARRGIGYIGEMVLGSVSATLLRHARTTPLWIIDGEIVFKNILIAVDGSVQSLRAVDHVAHILKNRVDIKIFLYHCSVFLAPEVVCSLDNFYREWDRDWCDKHLAGRSCLFDGPHQLLKEAGIPEEHIIVLPETSTLAESTSIISHAHKHACGTIVLGRRDPAVPKGFFGGVSNKTIRKTQNMAVWIVG